MTTYMLTQLMRRDYMELNWMMVQSNCDMFSAHEPEKQTIWHYESEYEASVLWVSLANKLVYLHYWLSNYLPVLINLVG